MKAPADKRNSVNLLRRLAKFDGKNTDVLTAVAIDLEPMEDTVDQLLNFSAFERPKTLQCFHWLLKTFLEDGL